MQLLISGAEQGSHGTVGVKAILLILDTHSGEILHQTTYIPPKKITHEDQKIQFTGFTWIGDELFVCTHNHIVVYDQWPPEKPSRIISEQGFNDLHHCYHWRGGLAVSNTGLETVDHISLDGRLIDRWDLLEKEEGARTLDSEKDYRLIPDTKPHLRHGNHLFELDGELWTSQLRTADAICVADQSKRLNMKVGMPHDGDVYNGQLIFTTTNGHLVHFDTNDNNPLAVPYNLTEMTSDLQQLGWCRGFCPVPNRENCFWIGFSALRRSKWKDFGFWIKHGHQMPRSRVALYDLNRGCVEQSWNIGESEPGLQIFQMQQIKR